MISTLEMTTVLDEAECLAQLILHSYEVHHYQNTRTRMLSDSHAQQLIQRFNDKKEQFEEVQRFGKYHPDYRSIHREVRQLKREMDLYEPIAAFKAAEKEVETMLAEVSQIVGYAVSDTIKVPTGNPFFDSIGCGGKGCGSGNCGCGN